MMATEEKREIATEPEEAADEAEGLRHENEALHREMEKRGANIVSLEQALASREGEIDALGESLGEAERRIASLGESLAEAVAAYKDEVIRANPGVLAELVTGDTVAEVNESLKHARALVERVRQEMEEEASRTRIPAGSPQRAAPDLSALSPREKIQYAIGGSQS